MPEFESESNSLNNQRDRAPVVVEKINAVNFVKSFLARGNKATTSAPAVGTISRAGRTGKVAAETVAIKKVISSSLIRTKQEAQQLLGQCLPHRFSPFHFEKVGAQRQSV